MDEGFSERPCSDEGYGNCVQGEPQHCTNGRLCMADPPQVVCKAVRMIGMDRIFVTPPEPFRNACPFHVRFGVSSDICHCPHRLRLFRKHGV